MMATVKGRAVRFPSKAVRAMGRTAGGVRGITLAGPEDRVVGMVVVRSELTLLTVTERGFGKRTPIGEYRRTHRGGKGVLNMRITDRNGPVVAIQEVADRDQIMLISSDGIVIRTPVKDVRVLGRATQGVRMIALQEGAVVADVARVPRGDDDEAPARPSGGRDGDGTRGVAAVSGAEVTDEMRRDAQSFADELLEEDELTDDELDDEEVGDEEPGDEG
jgi:DNA gyrase subunit A